MIDSHGRVIDYMRISVTDRCNYRCVYCMPEEGVESLCHEAILTFDEICDIVRVGADMGIRRVRLTGGEPLVRKGMVNLVREIAATPGIEDVSMTTNGVLLPKMAVDLKEAGLTRVNISLDTLDEGQFAAITRRGHVQEALDGIEAALAAGLDPVKVNAVAVRSLHQDYLAFAKLSLDRPLHMRFIEFMPLGDTSEGSGTGWGKEDVISCDELRAIVSEQGETAGLGPLLPAEESRPDGGGPAEYYRFTGAAGTVGFISPVSKHFCKTCNRLRLSADGKIRPCLFSDEELDIKTACELRGDEGIRDILNQAVGIKPDEHHDRIGTERKMSQIGG